MTKKQDHDAVESLRKLANEGTSEYVTVPREDLLALEATRESAEKAGRVVSVKRSALLEALGEGKKSASQKKDTPDAAGKD